jgi:phosphoribosylformylglycinamidine synthase
LKFVARVAVRLKPGVFDAEGKNVEKSLGLLNIPVESVSHIKTYEIVLERNSREEAEEALGEASRRLLANPVVHNYTITLEQA